MGIWGPRALANPTFPGEPETLSLPLFLFPRQTRTLSFIEVETASPPRRNRGKNQTKKGCLTEIKGTAANKGFLVFLFFVALASGSRQSSSFPLPYSFVEGLLPRAFGFERFGVGMSLSFSSRGCKYSSLRASEPPSPLEPHSSLTRLPTPPRSPRTRRGQDP